MKGLDQRGLTVLEFLITSLSLFSGLYFIFWVCFLGSNYVLAQSYLNDYAFCSLQAKNSECWLRMKRQIESLRFIQEKKLFIDSSTGQNVVTFKFDFQLPIIGVQHGVQNLQLTSKLDKEKWQ